MACLRGFEPLTICLEGRCSIQLSYRHFISFCYDLAQTPSWAHLSTHTIPFAYMGRHLCYLQLDIPRGHQSSHQSPWYTNQGSQHGYKALPPLPSVLLLVALVILASASGQSRVANAGGLLGLLDLLRIACSCCHY